MERLVTGQLDPVSIPHSVVRGDDEAFLLERIADNVDERYKGQYNVYLFYEEKLMEIMQRVLRGSDRFPTTGSGTPGRTKLRLDVAFNTDLSGLVKYSSQSDRKYDQVKKRLQRLANIEGVTRSTDFTDILPPEPRSQGKVLTPLPDASSGKWFDSTKPRLLENRSMPQIETHPEVSLGASPDIGMSISQMIYRKTLKLLSNIGLRETRHFARPSAG